MRFGTNNPLPFRRGARQDQAETKQGESHDQGHHYLRRDGCDPYAFHVGLPADHAEGD
jgi:hypothetical protein